ncbi:MAG: hypothetical protein LBG27_00430 [Spirochaetaceae bacterium]|jgi:hypothetical protein|nr:hypothetical protein [Spirochaetaceae bacterium]
MAILNQNKPFTLAEANRMSGNAETANLLAELQQKNDFLDEVPWFPTTHGSYTKEIRAKELDGGEFTEANAGIPLIGGATDVITMAVKMYEAESRCDDRILQTADDPYQAREIYDKIKLEGFMQDFNRRLLYPKTAGDDKAIPTLTERKAAISEDVSDPACNFVFDAGGAGTGLTSAWLFEFGRSGFHMIYNKAGSPGIKNEDKGLERVPAEDGSGYLYAWIRHYQIIANMVATSPRHFMRMANIDPSPGAKAGEGRFDPDILIEGMIPYLDDPRSAVLFVTRGVWGQINKSLYDKSNISYSRREVEGYGPVPEIMGIPIRPWDAISQNESQVA